MHIIFGLLVLCIEAPTRVCVCMCATELVHACMIISFTSHRHFMLMYLYDQRGTSYSVYTVFAAGIYHHLSVSVFDETTMSACTNDLYMHCFEYV